MVNRVTATTAVSGSYVWFKFFIDDGVFALCFWACGGSNSNIILDYRCGFALRVHRERSKNRRKKIVWKKGERNECLTRHRHTTTTAIKSSLDCREKVIFIDARQCGWSALTFDIAKYRVA